MDTPQSRYADFLKSEQWAVVSDAVKRRAEYRCQICNSPHDLQAHHRTYAHRGNEMNHLNDLICMCRRCHGVFHGKQPEQVAVHYPQVDQRPQNQVFLNVMVSPKNGGKKAMQQAIKAARLAAIEPIAKASAGIVKPSASYSHEADMPDIFPFTITRLFMKKLMTAKGGYTTATLNAIGVNPRLEVRGWTRRLEGKVITREQCLIALKGREVYGASHAL